MRISIICSDFSHPIMPYLEKWKRSICSEGYEIDIVSQSQELEAGKILFLISCSEKISKKVIAQFEHVLVLHASDLPKGRGWSPHIWEILNGSDHITLSLIEAAEQIDEGDIWKKIKIPIPKHSIWNEINNLLFTGEIKLMNWALKNHETVKPISQDQNLKPNYWPKRAAEDSRLDLNKSVLDQFDLLRVSDPVRYPAFFEINGKKFKLFLERLDNEKI